MNAAEPRTESRLRALLRILPTLFVLAALAAVGILGHRTGWKAPSFAALFGATGGAAQEDWCALHNVPDSQCVACHPELAGENPEGWCKEHGVPEARDSACHPELLTTGVAGDWCEEHGLPESGCTLCRPELAHKSALPAETQPVEVTNGAHERERGEDHPQGLPPAGAAALRDPRTCQKHALRVQFASVASLEKCGVVLGAVVERPMADSILVNAEVDYDRARYARLAPRVAGTARSVLHAPGESVQTGEILALVDAPEVGRALAELREARNAAEQDARALERMQRSSSAGLRTEGERLEAEARAAESALRLENARAALARLDLEEPPAGSAASSPVRAPFAGTVLSCSVVTGEVVDPARVLFEVADTARMWVTMDVPQGDVHRVKTGQEVIFRPDDARDEVVVGRVAWMSTAVDELTRTVRVRAEIANPGGALRAHSFGRAQIVVRTSPQAVAVPSEAVQWEGCCYVVFVRVGETLFQTRKVRLGAHDAAFTEVLGGVLPGEVVATRGSHVLKSEILKSSLGAGCADE